MSLSPEEEAKLEAQITAIEDSIAKGVRRVRFSTGPGVIQEVEYASIRDMFTILEMLRNKLASTTGTTVQLAKFNRWR